MNDSHQRAVVILDADWDGSPGAPAIQGARQPASRGGGSEFAVIVIDPELEAWFMNENAHLVENFLPVPGKLPADPPGSGLLAGGAQRSLYGRRRP